MAIYVYIIDPKSQEYNIFACSLFNHSAIQLGTMTENINKVNLLAELQAIKRVRLSENDACAPSTDTASSAPKFGSNLESLLRPHQMQAVEFIVQRLLHGKTNTMTDDSHNNLNFPETGKKVLPFATGAILADDMGTGKVTLI